MIDYSLDADGIVTLTWNVKNRPMNVLNQDSMSAYEEAVEKALGDNAVKGVIVTSARPEFIVGADLSSMDAGGGVEALYNFSRKIQALFRRTETGGKPFAAAINGHALGGGLETALACHYRVAREGSDMKIGLPESKLGLLPGAGGTQRLPRITGVQQALPLMLEGREISQEAAAKLGIIHKLVPAAELLAEAKRWLLEEGIKDPVQPWDKKGFRIPGGGSNDPRNMGAFTVGNALLHKKTYGNYPAQDCIMSAVFEGCITDIDTGLVIEARYFAKCASTPEAKNLIRLFFATNAANKLASRPEGYEKSKVTRLGVLGAGMMGAGIAYVSAMSGMEVILLDTAQEAAEKGKSYSAGLLEGRVAKGRMSQEKADAVLARITPTTDYELLKGAELVIEAVFENRDIKADVTRKAEAMLSEDAVFASNTSTLPITGLAQASARPGNFIGLHFFSPVDRMPLVEIIRGKETSDETLAKAMDYVQAIRKTPITVNDSRGFYTSRVFGTYVREGMIMLGEGINPALIENAGRMAGMPVGPLALADEVSLELSYKVGQQTKKDLGDKYIPNASDPMLERMVQGLGRLGKKVKKGFYDYPEGEKKHLWPGLSEEFPLVEEQPSVEEVIQRLMFIQSVETARCMEENVVTNPTDADIGSIMGWGFAPFRGGAISQIDTVGVAAFVEQCDNLAQRHGARFTPPQLLRDMASKGESFYGKKAA